MKYENLDQVNKIAKEITVRYQKIDFLNNFPEVRILNMAGSDAIYIETKEVSEHDEYYSFGESIVSEIMKYEAAKIAELKQQLEQL